jgi:hypothetical protein
VTGHSLVVPIAGPRAVLAIRAAAMSTIGASSRAAIGRCAEARG